MSISFQIKGLKRLDNILAKELPKVGKAQVGLAAIREAQKPVLADMKRSAARHKDSGATLASLGRRAKKNKNGKGFIGFVGAYHEKKRAVALAQNAGKRQGSGKKGRPIRGVFYSRFMEFGTKYQRAQPFIRPALEKNRRKATARIVRTLRRAVKRATR